jgi:hypothetical protein
MVRKGRFYVCGICGIGVWICKRCDRGHLYCSKKCSHEARRRTWKKSGRQSRQTEEGREGNARRQRDSYERRKSLENSKNLTLQGSVEPGSPAIILAEKAAEIFSAPPRETSVVSRSMQRLPMIEIVAHLVEIQDEPPFSSDNPRCHICGCPCREASSSSDQECP